MRFPNAYEGIKKVFTAQILSVIGYACTFLAAILALTATTAAVATGSETALVGGAIGGGIFVIGGAVLSIISLILNLVGLSRAGKDEKSFKTAFIISICSLIVSIVQAIIGNFVVVTPVVSVIFQIVVVVLYCIMVYYVITGIRTLASQISDTAMDEKGRKLFMLIAIVYIVELICLIVSMLVRSETLAVITVVVTIVAGIANIVAYIIYLVYLSKAKNMLAQH